MKKQESQKSVNRRQFLESSAKNAASVAAGMVGISTAHVFASPNSQISIGVIGIRGQGQFLAKKLASFSDVHVKTICDIDENLLPAATQAIKEIQNKAPSVVTDFRKVFDDPSIDAVVIATPDHWHAYMTILACQSGKDVYVEKPVSHNIREGEAMVSAANHYQRIVQTGTQQRSGSHFQSAIEFIKSGKLGKVNLAKAWTVHKRKSIGTGRKIKVPSNVHYDLWLGPAPEKPLIPNQFHYHWRWFWDYGTGELGNWGVHLLDIARWGLGVDIPIRVSSTGGNYYFKDDQQTPDTQFVQYQYKDSAITWEHRLWTNHGIENRSAAVAFYGDLGTLIVDRGGWKVYDQKNAITSDFSEQPITHLRNFIDCVKTRSQPVADIETGHISSVLCHLGNIAYRTGQDILIDSSNQKCNIINCNQASLLLGRESRKGWELPEIS